ncbi:hypothetical protein [Stakelama tenebrarum]|uniref:Lipoprotein n=1 Tax=Stakelama tenebrarum TaxID=2711215 RepID=A0A6G6Y877_9SPHN|nr:hypothetical protein [Sphingosinithalassobacter tenebrarum]QIG81119.1 hypothetical protein G5C33_15925 [Sphingosinithalassobacter tenebrarum]
MGGRNLRITILVPALAPILVAGCGPSEDEIANRVAAEVSRRLNAQQADEKAKAEASEKSAAERAREQRALREDIADARTIVLERMDEIRDLAIEGSGGRSMRFQLAVTNLDNVSWEWSERLLVVNEDAEGNGSGFADDIKYTIDPRDIGRVRKATFHGYPAVRFDCASGECITARGEKREGTDDGFTEREVNERRAYNVWPVASESDAERVVRALDTIVTASKAL